ncbi:MAG TPA: hypothetical protein VE173_02355 [Longimicrobiales bacterium]|nr:hypothetical protein [Longimicrobiales bacterium]
MRSVALLSASLLIGSTLLTGGVAAQRRAALGSATSPTGTPSSSDVLARALQRQSAAPAEGPTWKHRILTSLGGAAIGAGLGYFASQLVTGDWENRQSRQAVNRPTWAAVGGSFGLAIGFSFPLWGQGRPAVMPPLTEHRRLVITEEEIGELGLTDAYHAVQVLRPEWVNDRGPREWGDVPDDGLSVYVDGTRIGNLRSLAQLTTNDIESIHFVNAATATSRWGQGNSRGAILVIMKGAG